MNEIKEIKAGSLCADDFELELSAFGDNDEPETSIMLMSNKEIANGVSMGEISADVGRLAICNKRMAAGIEYARESLNILSKSMSSMLINGEPDMVLISDLQRALDRLGDQMIESSIH